MYKDYLLSSTQMYPQVTVEYVSEVPPLDNPTLVCGLPGSGYVGKLAVDYMINKLQATPFVNIYSTSFPPQISVQPNGTIDLVKNSMYYRHLDSGDIVLFTGDAQPVSSDGEYRLAEEILKLCRQIEVNQIFTLAAYITGNFSTSPKVFGAGTTPSLVDKLTEFGVVILDKGNITGMNGVIIGMAKRLSMDGMCLLGETSGYVVDAKASKFVLDYLCKILGITLDMSELEQKAKESEDIINALRSRGQLLKDDPSASLKSSTNEKDLGYIS